MPENDKIDESYSALLAEYRSLVQTLRAALGTALDENARLRALLAAKEAP